MKLNPQVTGNVGLYFCCYHLSRRGWNVMPTARNARGIDLVAYNGNAKEFIGVQVKSLSKRDPVPLGTNLEKFLGDFWIIVNNIARQDEPTAFIMLPDEVRSGAHRGEKEGRVSYWLQPNRYDRDEFRNAWDRIGFGSAPTSLPPAAD